MVNVDILGHGCKLQQNDKMMNVLFFFTIYLAHIYIASVCTFIHSAYTEDNYIFKKAKKKPQKTQKKKQKANW